MSFHSRSSSEVESTPYGEIMPVFFRDFRKDFDFNDVKEKVRDLFNDTEFDYIVKERGDAQILHLIWVLQNKSDDIILKFLDLICYEYKWIADKITLEVNEHSPETSIYLAKLKSIQRDNQNHTDFNVHRTKQFLNLRTVLRKLNPKYGLNSVILLGELGSGKKWLSLDVCSEYDVLKCMNFKIFWIDCVTCTSPQTDYYALKALMIKLNPTHQFEDYSITETMLPNMILRLKEQIKLYLESKEYSDCLLVLANVQNVKCQESFNLGCKRLIITRNKKVSNSLSPKLNKHLVLDEGLTITEFYLLLDNYIEKYNWRKDNGDLANDIFHMSNGDPYMLSIIARNLRDKKSNWLEWKKNLYNLQIPDLKFKRDIENSLKILSSEQLQLYATFAVFPYCAQIPVKLLAYLWNKKLYEAEEIVKKLHINSYVQKEILEDNDTIVCSLKYVYSSYIKNCSQMQQLINPLELHRKIVEYYQVEEHLNDRKDVDLDFGPKHDGYFFRCIGFHLYGADYKHLFSKLYKDFGFLGQKMRSVGLTNTLADLRDYDHEIFQGDRKYSLKKLIAFLAKIEEKIKHFPDCCLLQYALLSEDFIKDLAMQQIEKFSRRAWFFERGQYHQRRFTISLPQNPKYIRILEHDIAIVVLANNDIYLVDLSLNSSCSLLPVMDGRRYNANIIDINIFDNNNHLLTLDNYGNLKLWDISHEKRCIVNQRRDGKVHFNPSNYSLCTTKFSSRAFKQSITNGYGKNVAFYLEIKKSSEWVLHVALANGFVMYFNWNQASKKFEKTLNIIPMKTQILNIHSICKINTTHYMIMDYNDNSSINVTFLQIRNTQKHSKKFDWSQLVYYKVCENVVLLVFTHSIVRWSLEFHPGFDDKLEVLYESPNCAINCAKLLLDNQYLLLGTERGLLIFDVARRHETLQSSVSENISCIDNYDLDDDEYKSMIVCGSNNKNIVYIFGLRLRHDKTLVWEHSCLQRAEELANLEHHKNTRFLGNTLFDVSAHDDTLYAVDSKNRIHQICCAETKNWSIIPSVLITNQKIIAINCSKSSVFVAVENGDVLDLQQERWALKDTNIINKEFFLKTVDNILVTSSAAENTYITHMPNEKKSIIPILTKYCTMVMDNYLLIVNNYGTALLVECENDFSVIAHIIPTGLLADCDMKDNTLFLGFAMHGVHIYSLEKNQQHVNFRLRCEIHKDSKITCLTASADAKLFAIGLNAPKTADGLRSCGDIEVFKLNDGYREQLLFCLRSHINPVYDMMFSPQNDVLVSVSEQICFWNINYILNNPLDIGNRKRHSSRFTSQKSTEEVDFKVGCSQTYRRDCFLNIEQHKKLQTYDNNYQTVNNSMEQSNYSDEQNDDCVFVTSVDKAAENIWSYLTGPSEKPELFSCLKLDGNVAKQIFANNDFTQFYTIDDEGVYYNLKLIKPPTAITPDTVDTPDSSSCSLNAEYLPVHRLSIASSTMSGTDVVDDANT